MTDSVIRIENLGKRYRVGEWQPYGLLSESVGRLLQAPIRRLRGNPRTAKQAPDPWLWALRDVSFEVAPGEIVGIVGRNGAGKSTLLKILSRITSPTEGRVELEGRVSSLLEVGTGFHPELTGRENVLLNGAILGMPRKRIEAVFDKIVDYAEIERFIDTPVKFYSSGMKVRLGFAVAAHLDSEIMIVDEVLSVGDLAFRQKSLNTIERMCESGQTILLVTHNTATLDQLAQKCVYLEAGRVRDLGPTRSVLEHYQRDVFGAAGPPAAELPALFHARVRDPAARIEGLGFRDGSGRTIGALAAGAPAVLAFELHAERDIAEADLRLLFYRDGAVVRSDFGRSNVGLVSLRAGERRCVEISYPALPFGAGEITLVAFVAPHARAQPQDSISDFTITRLAIEPGGDTGAGMVRLDQSWRIAGLEETGNAVARTGS